MQPQFRGSGDVAHQIPHSGNERSHNKHPSAQIMKPVLGPPNLLIVYRKPMPVPPDEEATRCSAKYITHGKAPSAPESGDGDGWKKA